MLQVITPPKGNNAHTSIDVPGSHRNVPTYEYAQHRHNIDNDNTPQVNNSRNKRQMGLMTYMSSWVITHPNDLHTQVFDS